MPYFIRPAEIADCYTLARNLRSGDLAEVLALGLCPRTALRACYRGAVLRWTCVVDGEVAAMFGMGGNMLSDVGMPWLLTGHAVERLSPRLFFRIARWAVDEMLRHRSKLEGYVAADYVKACRLLEALHFTLEVPQLINGAPFRRFHVGF